MANTKLGRTLVTLTAVAVIAVGHLGLLDDAGRDYADKGLKRALISYGVARALNGVISVAQGTEVAVEPVGVGVTFKPGEILDPINDLIERFSWILLASGTSLGIQKVLLEVSAFAWFGVVVSLFAVAGTWLLWRPESVGDGLRRFIQRGALVLVILRFAIPVAAIGSGVLYRGFLEPRHDESTQRLQEAADAIKTTSGESTSAAAGAQPQGSILESARRAYHAAREAVDVEERIEILRKSAADIGGYTIDLIVVFVLETIIFPLLFLWAALQLARRSAAVGAKG